LGPNKALAFSLMGYVVIELPPVKVDSLRTFEQGDSALLSVCEREKWQKLADIHEKICVTVS